MNNIVYNNISNCQKIRQWVSKNFTIENKTEWNIAKFQSVLFFLLQTTIIVVF